LPKKLSGANRDKKKRLEILNRTQIGKGTHTSTLCQKMQETAKFKQKQVTVGGRSAYRTLSPKRTPSQNGIDKQSSVRKVPRESWLSTHILCECEAIAYLRFCHQSHYFMEPDDLFEVYDCWRVKREECAQ
jgi:hypothetical protein